MYIDNLIKSLELPDDEYIVVGVSAGPDSMALLNLLKTNLDKKIVCAHVNHNKRKESQEEEDYLKEYCHNSNTIFECYHINNYQENNFENEARNKRYNFYEEILKKYHSHTLFLAHHGDDLIETILMKIIRGSNLEGYAGIKMYSKMNNYTIIRPLLSLTKEDLLKYNKDNNIKYYIDITNEDTTYKRNRIRKNILPLLKEEDPLVHQKFLTYSNTIQEYYNYLEDITLDKIKMHYQNNTINIDIFRKEHPLIKKNIIFYLLSNIYDNHDNIIKNKHIEDIIKLTENSKPNLTINLPQGYFATKIYNKIIISNNSNNDNSKNDYDELFTDSYQDNGFTISKLKPELISNFEDNGNNVCRLNSSKIVFPLHIRYKKNGDYIYLLGLNGKKKVSDIFIENKIPKNLRNHYPLLVDNNDNIIWIPNLKKSKYNVKKNEICDIILTSYYEGGNINEEKEQ